MPVNTYAERTLPTELKVEDEGSGETTCVFLLPQTPAEWGERRPQAENASEIAVERRSEAFCSCRLVPEMGFVENATSEKSRELSECRPL